jgi:hypothetical protein
MFLVNRGGAAAQPPVPESPRRPTRGQIVRGVTVVSGGPVTLALGSLLAPFSAAGRWPRHLHRGRVRNAAWSATVVGLVVPWLYAGVVRPWLMRWGSTDEERQRRYPSDGDVEPLFVVTRAVTVHAPADEVWRWLVQIGQDRGGFYSYDWLENLAGCRLHSADEIHEEWQSRSAGDVLMLLPGFGPRIQDVAPPRWMVIEGWGAYVVEPVDAQTCRLVARSHQDRGPAAIGYVLALELPHAIMERKMLLGLKRRAEASARSNVPV